jgi:hypothetical protein
MMTRLKMTMRMPTSRKMSPTLWMLKPEVCTEIANLRMAPTTTRTIPKDVRPMPEDLFIAATSNRDLSLQTFTRLTSIQPARSASCLHRPRCSCARPPARLVRRPAHRQPVAVQAARGKTRGWRPRWLAAVRPASVCRCSSAPGTAPPLWLAHARRSGSAMLTSGKPGGRTCAAANVAGRAAASRAALRLPTGPQRRSLTVLRP